MTGVFCALTAPSTLKWSHTGAETTVAMADRPVSETPAAFTMSPPAHFSEEKTQRLNSELTTRYPSD